VPARPRDAVITYWVIEPARGVVASLRIRQRARTISDGPRRSFRS